MAGPLDGLLVVSLEQAVAAPYCASRLADAGARVIKIERPEGDFARGYDRVARGQSAYFVWLNRGKESIVLDIKYAGDKALLARMIARADVFIQNLAPGAAARAGFASTELRARHPRLVTCDISGYGETGREWRARNRALSKPARAAAPGARFWMKTSARAIMRAKSALSAAALMSRAIDSLPRLSQTK